MQDYGSSDAYKLLRKYFNPAIDGTNTRALLESLSNSIAYLSYTAETVKNQCYVATAVGQYLDRRLASYGITRPAEIGLFDDDFRNIGIQIINRKQVRDLLNNLLRILFGDQATQASFSATNYEPYNLTNGDQLLISYDGEEPVIVTFQTSQFANIASATAEEVASAITNSIRSQSRTGRAFASNDGTGNKVYIISDAIGPRSSVQVLGGKAQNIFKFPTVEPTTGILGTAWTVQKQISGLIRYTWTGGADPSLGVVQLGDYVNIFGTNFVAQDTGTFNVVTVQGGTVGNAYFEIDNPVGSTSSYIASQAGPNDVLFYVPTRFFVNQQFKYAAVFQDTSNLLEIFIPSSTVVVRRDRKGSAYIQPNPSSPAGLAGPYTYSKSQIFYLTNVQSTIDPTAYPSGFFDAGSGSLLQLVNASSFPDQEGFIYLGYGTSHAEGPVPYIARPDNQSLIISPAYIIQKRHPVGTDVGFVPSKSSVPINALGDQYPFYLTGTAPGRLYAQSLIESVVAAGVNVQWTILYPSSIGLGGYDTVADEKTFVWG